MFNQGSFYPLMPPSIDVSLDSALAAKFAQINTIPNMLIVPSDSKGFIRVQFTKLQRHKIRLNLI